jgi:hypothetical protein
MTMLLGAFLAAVLAQVQPHRDLAGQVVDDQGRPVAEARVVVYAPPLTWGKENTAEAETTTDAEGRFRLTIPPLGRRLLNGVGVLVYRPGKTIAATSYFRHPDRYVVHKPEPRPVRVEGPDGHPVAGVRITPRVLAVFNESPLRVPDDLAETLAVTTGPDGRATIPYLTARDQLGAARVATGSIGAQDILLVKRPGQGSSEPVITIRLGKTSRLSGRIVDESGGPVADREVEIWSRGDGNRLSPDRIELAGGPLRTAADGSFRTPDNLLVGSAYRVVVRGPGQEPILSDWLTIEDHPRALLPFRLRALRSIAGRVTDRQGKPVAGIEAFQTGDGPEPTSTRSGPDGRFVLGGFRQGPVFLLARGDGFRFHGQLIRGDQREAAVELTRTGERPTRAMHLVPEPIPTEESRGMARRLVEPVWEVVAATGDDRIKFRTLEALASADPAGALERLEATRFVSGIWEARARRAIAEAMAVDDPEEAAGVAESIADPGPRASALIDVVDALPVGHRDRRLALLDRAAPHVRAVPDAAERLRLMGDLAERWYNLDEVEKARALFAEGRRLADQMPDKKKHERVDFAAQLATVDPEAALAIARDFKGVRVGGSWRVVWGLQVIDRDPADGVFFWRETRSLPRSPSYASFAWKLTTVDPARARRIMGYIPMLAQLSETPAYLALAEGGRDEAAVGRLLDEALRRIDRRLMEPPDRILEPSIGYVLPVVERVDPARVPEFFWREVASRVSSDNPRILRVYSPIEIIPYLAGYDREVAAAVFEPMREQIERTDDRELATWAQQFRAWSHFDPRGAAARLERVAVRRDPAPDANAARLAVAHLLGLDYQRRLNTTWSYRPYVLDGDRVTPSPAPAP